MLAERCLALAEMAIARSLEAQIKAGAKAVMICEPAANIVYLSPRQMSSGIGHFRALRHAAQSANQDPARLGRS